MPGQTLDQALRNTLEKAEAAQEARFHVVWTGGGHLGQGIQSTLLQAHVIAHVAGMDLGTLYLLPLEDQITLAEEISTLNLFSGGCMTVAVAQGWREFQFKTFGLDPKERLSRFLETPEVMKQLWTQDVVNFHGRHLNIEVDRPIVRPVQQPYPRLLVAANADRGIQRTARIADGCLISTRATMPAIEHQAGVYRQALKESGNKGPIGAWREAYVATSKRRAMEIIRPSVEAMYADRVSLGHTRDLPEVDRIDVPFEQILENRFVIGSPEE